MALIDRPKWWAKWVDEFLPEYPLSTNTKLEQLHLKCRDLACNLIEEKIKSYFYKNKIKFISVDFEEYSNSDPKIVIKLPYKGQIYDTFYVFFNRNNWYGHIRIWLPTNKEYHTCCSGSHKKNRDIVEKLQDYLSVGEITQTVNFPFRCQNKSLS